MISHHAFQAKEELLHWYNLGTIALNEGRLPEAVEAFERALALDPQEVDTLYNLALAYTGLEKLPAAAHCYHRALSQEPRDREVLYNLGLLYRRMSRYSESLRHLHRVIEVDPDYAPAYGHLGAMLVELGERDAAIICFEKLVSLNHQVEAAKHLLAALRQQTPEAPPKDYVAALFDNYAGKFESELMEELGYRVPFLLAEMLRELEAGRIFPRLLDLGCGTGLAGEAFLAHANSLTGVDISRGMLEQAEAKEIYDHLHCMDLLDFCRECRNHYELVAASDVLNYLGDLKPFFELIPRCMPSGGLLLFSIEEGERDDFVLRESGRYAHNPEYIRFLAKEYDFQVLRQRRTGLRREREQWVNGYLYILVTIQQHPRLRRSG